MVPVWPRGPFAAIVTLMVLAELGECTSTLETTDGCSVLDALGKLEGGEMEEPASMQGTGGAPSCPPGMDVLQFGIAPSGCLF